MTKHKHVAGGEKAHKIQTKVQNKTEKVLVVKIASYDSAPSAKKIYQRFMKLIFSTMHIAASFLCLK